MSSVNGNKRLEELGGSDYKIVDGEPNIKGWKVKDARGKTLGEVDELIFDHQTQKVRYIVLDLEGNEIDLEDREILVPIGLAELHEVDDEVILPAVSTIQLQALPEYDSDSFSSETESRIREIFSGTGLGSSAEQSRNITDNDYYNSDNLLRRRVKRVSGNTVIGIFDNGFDAQNTISKLKLSGFNEDQIDICTKNPAETKQDYTFMHDFFDNLINNKEQASHYTEVAKQGTVVTVHTISEEDAQRAAEILDQHGSINMSNPSQSGVNHTENDRKDMETSRERFRSKIIGRSVGNDMRLRSGGQPGSTTPNTSDPTGQSV